jgi:xanthine dehydrogenase accessory factor
VATRITGLVLAAGPSTDAVAELALAIHGTEATSLGLTCGGSMQLVIEPLQQLPNVLVDELRARAPVAFATRLDTRDHRTLVIDANGASTSTLGDVLVDQDVITLATELLRRGRSARRVEQAGATRVLIDIYEPTPRAVIVGAGDLATALEEQLHLIGWESMTLTDLSGAVDAIADLTRTDAVVVLTHDPTIDAPTLAAALRNDIGYVGALGSRRTQAARAERLQTENLEARALTALRGPPASISARQVRPRPRSASLPRSLQFGAADPPNRCETTTTPSTSPTEPTVRWTVEPIGYARTDYHSPLATPVQAALNPDALARVELDPRYAPALRDLEHFSHAWIVTWLANDDRQGDIDLQPVPFLLRPANQRIGLFATRAPRRPNPIGLSLVRIDRIEACDLYVRGVDLVDATPVLDIKPYAAPFDTPYGTDIRNGWLTTSIYARAPHRKVPSHKDDGASRTATRTTPAVLSV